jgi:outer membrane protein TolC
LANKRRSWDSPLLSGDLTGSAGTSKTSKGGETHAGAAKVNPTLTQRFVHGGVLTLDAVISLATDFSGSDTTSIGSLLGASFTQPLLRGAWDNIAYEAQYRLERDFLIAVFGYQRFIQSFEAGIFTSHYEVLRLQDKVRNEKENIKRLGETANLTSIKVEGGRVSRIELDQANQNLFNAQISYEEDMQKYRDALDLFKIEIGLPVLANMELDYPVALEELAKDGLPPVGFAEDQAINTALAVRPDVLAQRAKLRDARRDVEIAADAFLPQLDVTVGIAALSGGQRDFYNIRFDRNTRTASATFNYELDQTEHRNVYRRSLIALVRETRDYQEFVDNIRLQVRQSYRQLAQTRRTYELQRLSVDLARRRRSLAALQQKEGLASARDVLESEAALNEAQNGLTEKLVSYTSTRVRFLAALGLIDVDEKGLMHERSKPFNFERIGRRYPYVASDQSN